MGVLGGVPFTRQCRKLIGERAFVPPTGTSRTWREIFGVVPGRTNERRRGPFVSGVAPPVDAARTPSRNIERRLRAVLRRVPLQRKVRVGNGERIFGEKSSSAAKRTAVPVGTTPADRRFPFVPELASPPHDESGAGGDGVWRSDAILCRMPFRGYLRRVFGEASVLSATPTAAILALGHPGLPSVVLPGPCDLASHDSSPRLVVGVLVGHPVSPDESSELTGLSCPPERRTRVQTFPIAVSETPSSRASAVFDSPASTRAAISRSCSGENFER